MKIRHVFQPDDTGCGIACTAMLTGKTYQEVKQQMISIKVFRFNAQDWGTSFKDIKLILSKNNIHTMPKRKFRRWCHIPAKIAIVSTSHSKKGDWHWVVFVRDSIGHYIYDPGKRRKRIRDLRGKRCGHFIEVQ